MAYIYRSITLAAGESYVLPAGAELVGVSGSITDEAGCASLANVETLGCYIAGIGAYSAAGDPTYGETNNGSGEYPLVCKGAYQNGIYIPFTSGDLQAGLGGGNAGCFDGIVLGTKLIEIIPGIIQIDASSVNGTSPSAGNCLTFIQIQTVPSLAENLYLWMAHSVSMAGDNPGGTDFIIPFKTRQYWLDATFTALPADCIAAP
jgi:hypothetical protein